MRTRSADLQLAAAAPCTCAVLPPARPARVRPRPRLLLPLPTLLPAPALRSYAIAIGYVCFDTYDKWGKTEADARTKLSARPIPDSVDLER